MSSKPGRSDLVARQWFRVQQMDRYSYEHCFMLLCVMFVHFTPLITRLTCRFACIYCVSLGLSQQPRLVSTACVHTNWPWIQCSHTASIHLGKTRSCSTTTSERSELAVRSCCVCSHACEEGYGTIHLHCIHPRKYATPLHLDAQNARTCHSMCWCSMHMRVGLVHVALHSQV